MQTSDVDLSDGEEDADDNTPLYYATQCFDGSVEQVVHLLLSAGANVNHAGHLNSSPLEIACGCQNFRVAAVLLEAGALVENDLLKNCVAKINAKSAGGSVPDKLVSKYGQLQKKVISEVVQKIGSHINGSWGGRREETETALMQAVREGDLSTVKLLLELGVAVDARGGSRRTALIVAAHQEKLDMVKALLAAGADVNLTDVGGRRAIYYVLPREVAYKKNCRDIWALLLKAGSNITEQAWYGANLGYCSLFEQAVYEAWQGKSLTLDVIKKYSKRISFGKVMKADRFIREADHFLQSTEYSTTSKFGDVTEAFEPLYAIYNQL